MRTIVQLWSVLFFFFINIIFLKQRTCPESHRQLSHLLSLADDPLNVTYLRGTYYALLEWRPKTPKKKQNPTWSNMFFSLLGTLKASQHRGRVQGRAGPQGAPRDSPWALGPSVEEGGEARHVCSEHHPSTAGLSLLALRKNFWEWLMFNLNLNIAKALSVPCAILQRPVFSFFSVPAVQKTPRG